MTDATERAVRAALRISARNGCALTRDAAEQIAEAIPACAAPGDATAVTEWGARRPDLASGVFNAGSDEDAEKMARLIAGDQEQRGVSGALVRRTVTYGPWEEIRDDH